MPNRIQSKITCAQCGAGLHSEAHYDEHAENYFCELGCFRDWADHTQKPIEYYARHNVSKIELSEEGEL